MRSLFAICPDSYKNIEAGKVLKVIFAWLKVVPILHFLCGRNLSACCIQNGHILTN